MFAAHARGASPLQSVLNRLSRQSRVGNVAFARIRPVHLRQASLSAVTMAESVVKLSQSPESKITAKLEPSHADNIGALRNATSNGVGPSLSQSAGPSNGLADQGQDEEDYLTSLSVAQRNAVTAPPDEPLQILAGPGSGKTRVLVSRVTWLVLHHKIEPRDLFVVTFTNKAANEMRTRLGKLIGPMRTSQLIIGTFHATCAKYLRRYASLVGIGNNFSICDSDESKRIIKAILKEKEAILKSKDGSVLRAELCMAEISRAKAKNLSPEEYSASLDEKQAEQTTAGRRPESMAIRRVVAKVYEYYADHLTSNNALDFDDLLVYGVKLFANNPRVTANLRHVLIDEYQDVNSAQYLLMSALAGRGGSRGAVSIVGDPDQSIYGWRSAEVGNINKMVDDFAAWAPDGKVRRVFLEENYRSTAHILQAAKSIIEASSSRIDRGLYTSHAKGPAVVLKQFISSRPEANFIATEIKRVIAHSGGLLTYDDFAILLRYNALSREVEQQLMTESIPSRIMGGARFFERKEVKDLLAYLMLADNPGFTPALSRVINTPKRAIGDKSVKDLHTLAEEEGVPTMTIVERVADAPTPILGVKPLVQKNLRQFVDVIRQIREMAEKNDSVANIINKVMESIGYEAHLKKEQDFEQRWENVKELISFSKVIALDVEQNANLQSGEGAAEADTSTPTLLTQLRKITSSQVPSRLSSSQAPSQAALSSQANDRSVDVIELLTTDEEDSEVEVTPSKNKGKKTAKIVLAAKAEPTVKADVGDTEDGFQTEELADEDKTPLRVFLEACTLSTDMEEKTEDNTAKTPKVTIATAHAAKGLEFGVVFVLAVEEGTYPFYRSSGSTEEIDEETRLLYVAVTRAQAMAYLTYCSFRYVNGEEQSKTLSRFVSRIAEVGTYPDGQWRPQPATIEAPQPGGFVRAPGYQPVKAAPKKVDFGKQRPTIGQNERRVFAKVLGRAMPTEAEAEKIREKFDESDAGSRIKRLDNTESPRTTASGSSNPFGSAAFARSATSLFAMKDESTSMYTPIVQTASSFANNGGGGRGISSSSGFSSAKSLAHSSGLFGSAPSFGNANGHRFNTAAAASSAAASLGGGGRYPPSVTTVNRTPHPHSALARLATFNGGSSGAAPAGKRLGMGRAPATLPKKPRQE